MIAGSPTTRQLPRTKPKGRHPQKALSPAFIRSAPPGRHADGNGLYLFVQPSGTRSWIQRLLIRGRRRELGLGSVVLVPLAEAREKALANRKLAREGGDLLAEKRRAEGIPTFAEAAMRVLEQKQDAWRNQRHS
ncbi:MAG: Arm DNA-binding domain-containing protein, partial [Acidobacteria bacterium]|nr:Arm DNA-binding domain-containing protein [Acidobacteriota bacterium]